MMKRRLGRTGRLVGEIGLGTEYLHKQPRDTVVDVVRHALDMGVNYFDVVFTFADYLDNLGAALSGRRDQAILAVHLGPAETAGQYRKSRDRGECRALFEDTMRRLGTDYAEVVIVQFVDEDEDYRGIMGPGGLYELARELCQKGYAGQIGLSTHEPAMAERIAAGDEYDLLMYSYNMLDHADRARLEPLFTCVSRHKGLVAMKPFAGGRLLQGEAQPRPSPVQCLAYVLSQPGTSTAVPGVKNLEELNALLAYLEASDDEKDYSACLASLTEGVMGQCVYCNHCLPCPQRINVGEVLRILAVAERGVTPDLISAYRRLDVPASACVACGECMPRCPFGVDVIAGMGQVADLFVEADRKAVHRGAVR